MPAKPTEEKPYVRKLQRIESPVRQPRESTSPPKTETHTIAAPHKNDEGLSAKPVNDNLKRSTAQKNPNLMEMIKSEKKKQKTTKKPEPMEVDKEPAEKSAEKEFLFVST